MATLAGYLSLLENAAVRAMLPLLLAALIVPLMRRASAARRHLVWSIALSASLLLPVLSICLPSWHAFPAWHSQRAGADTSFALPSISDVQVIETLKEPVDTIATVSAPMPVTRRNWPGFIVVIWILAAALMIVRVLMAMFSLRRLEWKSQIVRDDFWGGILGDLCARIPVGRRVRLLSSSGKPMPMTWGILRPRVLLPAEAEEWSMQRRQVVLAHELCHVRRWDAATQLAGELALALYWFNPLAWLAVRRLAVERERACDDMVLLLGTRASDYAEELFAVATGFAGPAFSGAAGIAMARSSKLQRRMLAILDSTRDRRAATTRALIAAGLALAVILPPLAMLRSKAAVAAVILPATQPALADSDPQTMPAHAQAQYFQDQQLILDQAIDRLKSQIDQNISNVATTESSAIIRRATLQVAQMKEQIQALSIQMKIEEEKALAARNTARNSAGAASVIRPSLVRPLNGVWKATLSNGVQLELVGVSEHPSRGKPWWKPDGSPLAQAPYEFVKDPFSVSWMVRGEQAREIAFRVTNQNSEPVGLSWSVKPQTDRLSVTTSSDAGAEDIHSMAVVMPTDQKAISVRIGVAAGEWKMAGIQPRPSDEADMDNMNGPGQIVFAPATESDGNAVVVAASTINNFDMRLIAIGYDHKEHIASSMSNGGNATLHQISARFNGLPLKDVFQFVLQTRPYEWVQFQDIAMQQK